MTRPFSLNSSLLLAFAMVGCFAASCQETGATSICPPLPLYQTHPLGDASVPDAQSEDSPAVQAELARAIDAGCVIPPSSFPSDGGMGGAGPVDGPGSGGTPGAAGSSASAAGSH